jgi:hypothetical protein
MLAEDSGVDDGGGWGGVTLAYNVRSPAEVDEVLEQAEAPGATIPRAGAETFWGGVLGGLRGPRRPPLGGGAQPGVDPARRRLGRAPAVRGLPARIRGSVASVGTWMQERKRRISDAGFTNLEAVLDPGEQFEVAVQGVAQVGRAVYPAFVGVTQHRVLLYVHPNPRLARPFEMVDGLYAFPRSAVKIKRHWLEANNPSVLRLKTPLGPYWLRGSGMRAVREALEGRSGPPFRA